MAKGSKGSHAPEVTTHINSGHNKPNIFYPSVASRFSKEANPKCDEGKYANAGKPSRQEKM